MAWPAQIVTRVVTAGASHSWKTQSSAVHFSQMICAGGRRCWNVGRLNVVVPVVGEALAILGSGLHRTKGKNYCLHTDLPHLGNVSAFFKTRNAL